LEKVVFGYEKLLFGNRDRIFGRIRIFGIGNAPEYSVSTEVENSGFGRSLVTICLFFQAHKMITLWVYNESTVGAESQ
jgi:hypothetical protein